MLVIRPLQIFFYVSLLFELFESVDIITHAFLKKGNLYYLSVKKEIFIFYKNTICAKNTRNYIE